MAIFKGVEEQESGETIIGANVTLTGNLKSSSAIHIFGKVKGRIQTKSDVEIGEKALVDGGIKSKNAKIIGTIQGNIEVTQDLEIFPTGKIFGDLNTRNLIIQKGGAIVGKVLMEREAPALEDIEKEAEEGELEAGAEEIAPKIEEAK